jgi:hypothetical protein
MDITLSAESCGEPPNLERVGSMLMYCTLAISAAMGQQEHTAVVPVALV